MSLNHVSAIGLAVMLLLTGCIESENLEKTDGLTEVSQTGENILGCTYKSADNFQSNATVDDGSCLFEDSLKAEYGEGYSAGFKDGSVENDYFWDCTAVGSYGVNDGLAGIGVNALDDFSEESFYTAWSEQPGSPNWCGTELSYDSLELGESVMPVLEDEKPEYFHWQGYKVGARSDRYFWDNYHTEVQCEQDVEGVWKSINGHGFCGDYLEGWVLERDANLIYEYDSYTKETSWSKYEIFGDYFYIGHAMPIKTYDDGYNEGYSNGSYDSYNKGYGDGYNDGLSSIGGSVSTLDVIMERGYMMCGVKNSQYGMGYLEEEDGTYSGLDIEYCKAIAAAIGLDPEADVEYVLATGSNRFELLAYEEIDVLIRTSTWTTSRDTHLDADFAAINFYDGQGLLVRNDAFAYANGSATELDGANICVGTSTTSEGNLDDWFMTNGISFTLISVGDHYESVQMLKDGGCDAYSGDMSAMIAVKWEMENDSDWTSSNDYSELWITTELLSKEPLASATRDYDTEWNEVVSWVWYGMLTAEELGVNSTNYEELAENSCDGEDYDAAICRLLTQNLGLGTDVNPLSEIWMQGVLAAVGNYQEAYTESFCTYDDSGDCLIDRAGTANAPWWEGGLQYAPPMR